MSRLNRLRYSRHTAAAVVLGAALVGGLAGCSNASTAGVASTQGGSTSSGSTRLDDTSMPPWSAPTNVPARVAKAGLDIGPMGMAEHYHPHLRIVIANKEVPVAGNLGVDPATGAMSAVHTHQSDGTIHIEAGEAGEQFTLGQLFTEWGVRLTRTQIGGVRAKAGRTVTVTSNGTPVQGDPMNVGLKRDQQIVIRLP